MPHASHTLLPPCFPSLMPDPIHNNVATNLSPSSQPASTSSAYFVAALPCSKTAVTSALHSTSSSCSSMVNSHTSCSSIVLTSSVMSTAVAPSSSCSAIFSSLPDINASLNSAINAPSSCAGLLLASRYATFFSSSSQQDAAVSSNLSGGEKPAVFADYVNDTESHLPASCGDRVYPSLQHQQNRNTENTLNAKSSISCLRSEDSTGDNFEQSIGNGLHRELCRDDLGCSDGEKKSKFNDSGILSGSEEKEKGNEGVRADSDLTVSLAVEDLKCLLCSESFLEPDQVTRHMQAHSADMTHRCQVCGAAFLSPDLLQQHKKAHSCHSHPTRVQTGEENDHCKRRSWCVSSSGRPVPQVDEAGRPHPTFSMRANNTVCEVEKSKGEPSCLPSATPNEGSDIYDGDTDVGSDSENSEGRQQARVGMHQEKDLRLGEPELFLLENSEQHKSGSASELITECHNHSQAVNASNAKNEWCGCQHCGKSFYSLDNLVRHARCHYQLLSCKICDKVFSSLRLRKTHCCLKVKLGEADSHKLCDLCNVTLSTPAQLAEHAQTHAVKRRSQRKGCKINPSEISSKTPSHH